MMTRELIASVLLSGVLLGTAVPAYAQVTDQTDQSEEDWRKSRKKRGSSDIYKSTSPTDGAGGIFGGGEVVEVSPVERLPSESRRHLMRERAKAIAESADGDISDAEYVPSEEAKSDEALMRDEQEAWEAIVTDLEGSGGQATTPSEGGPNKVAVLGRNGTAPAPGSRGGSTATLQEIMDAIKSGRMGNGSGGGQGSSQGDTRGERGDGRVAGAVGTMPVGLPQGMPGGQGQPGSANGAPSGTNDGTGGEASAQDGSDGDADRTSRDDGASDGQSPQDGAQSGAASTPDQGAQSGASAQDGAQSGSQGQAGAQGQSQASASSRAPEDLSPLERIRRAREDREAGGSERSASDYLGRD